MRTWHWLEESLEISKTEEETLKKFLRDTTDSSNTDSNNLSNHKWNTPILSSPEVPITTVLLSVALNLVLNFIQTTKIIKTNIQEASDNKSMDKEPLYTYFSTKSDISIKETISSQSEKFMVLKMIWNSINLSCLMFNY